MLIATLLEAIWTLFMAICIPKDLIPEPADEDAEPGEATGVSTKDEEDDEHENEVDESWAGLGDEEAEGLTIPLAEGLTIPLTTELVEPLELSEFFRVIWTTDSGISGLANW